MSGNSPMEALSEKIRERVGSERLFHYQTKILPSVFMDFYSMLDKSSEGSTISEEYKLDNGELTILLTGVKKAGSRGKEGISITDADVI